MTTRDFTIAGAARHLNEQVATGKMSPTLAWDTLAGVIRRADAETAAEVARYEVPVKGGGWVFCDYPEQARSRALEHDGVCVYYRRRMDGSLSAPISAAEDAGIAA